MGALVDAPAVVAAATGLAVEGFARGGAAHAAMTSDAAMSSRPTVGSLANAPSVRRRFVDLIREPGR